MRIALAFFTLCQDRGTCQVIAGRSLAGTGSDPCTESVDWMPGWPGGSCAWAGESTGCRGGWPGGSSASAAALFGWTGGWLGGSSPWAKSPTVPSAGPKGAGDSSRIDNGAAGRERTIARAAATPIAATRNNEPSRESTREAYAMLAGVVAESMHPVAPARGNAPRSDALPEDVAPVADSSRFLMAALVDVTGARASCAVSSRGAM
jgi:hypothetical protein